MKKSKNGINGGTFTVDGNRYGRESDIEKGKFPQNPLAINYYNEYGQFVDAVTLPRILVALSRKLATRVLRNKRWSAPW